MKQAHRGVKFSFLSKAKAKGDNSCFVSCLHNELIQVNFWWRIRIFCKIFIRKQRTFHQRSKS
ncbi:hypothetical protein NC651_005780 [Populus alba x Populus x berolinensis]|nr:hypothetical protein NC651_005780 [Populus alba x Populus x berolinensis]